MGSTQELDILTRLDTDLARITDLDTVLERILKRAREHFSADAGSIYIREGHRLRFANSQCETLERRLVPGGRLIYRSFKVPINAESLAGHVALTGEVLAIDDAYCMPEDLKFKHSKDFDEKAGYRTHSIITVPLKTNEGEVIGVLQLINKWDENENVVPFSREDILAIGHFAMRAALALYQARLTRSLVMRMIAMAEMRDPTETGPHANRVAAYATELYRFWAGVNGTAEDRLETQCDSLRTAAMLHDVGKVGISDAILRKPGKLTEEEFAVMKQHTVIGARLFANHESQMDRIAAIVAHSHHENWDGSGYPGHRAEDGTYTGKGLAGDEIPLMAHMVSIADVFDALCSPRAYKDAWSPDEAFAEIKKLAGSKFSPELVDMFMHIRPVILAVQARYPDE